MSQDFRINQSAIGGVVTATQLGCALALLFLVPLGDKVARKKLTGLQLSGLICALVTVGLARTSCTLLAGMLAVGLLGTAMTQGLIAYAASVASESERGRVVGAAQTGVFIGLLLSRVFSGAISDVTGWRGVYFCAALMMLLLAWPLWRGLPAVPVSSNGLSYARLLASMWSLLRHDKVLQVRGTLAMLMFASFNIFWSALVLPLSASPYHFSHTAIGSFGLEGRGGR